MRAIFTKEWTKLKPLVPLCLILLLASAFALWHHVRYLFISVEPESMAWYRFSFLGEKPYSSFLWLYFLVGVLVAVVQFLPERLQGRMKLLAHLPLRPFSLLALHLSMGVAFLGVFALLLSGVLYALIGHYYPAPVGIVALKDSFFYALGSILAYSGLSAAILEKSSKRALLKLTLTLAIGWIYAQPPFGWENLGWIGVGLFLMVLAGESFLRIKDIPLRSPAFFALAFLALGFAGVKGVGFFLNHYTTPLTHYYLFYSPIAKTFVYQRNFGGHQFEYGTKEGETFDRLTYEGLLPFVYWRNFEIQGKLPLEIDGTVFEAEEIKESRLSFAYTPSALKPKEVALLPLINPKAKTSMIPFPEEVLHVKKDAIVAYGEHARVDTKLTQEIATLAADAGVRFPLRHVWGKHTNLKPHDFGMFLADSQGALFNLKRYDNRTTLEAIQTPPGLELFYMYPSENRANHLAGYAIDAMGKMHVLLRENWEFIPLVLPNFDYTSMQFQLIQDPLHYLVRYDNGTEYYAVLFSKDFTLLDTTSFSSANKGSL
ncbi:DUF4857 domain-containing protein [Sulfurospirillum sp. T05]|uniref:DUF4857 domain-containing protein n=1 Tax=Sulfurospirillum tamanense TaxID=2813362 RepID=A0ABS2WRV9_9BACT|nr:DUF4857 domain-containing protein [Sulfurospirillum tamanensis]MBN2964411.1 DUF4857 domain-containing protein [Sulfurospirillum tamanensis]